MRVADHGQQARHVERRSLIERFGWRLVEHGRVDDGRLPQAAIANVSVDGGQAEVIDQQTRGGIVGEDDHHPGQVPASIRGPPPHPLQDPRAAQLIFFPEREFFLQVEFALVG